MKLKRANLAKLGKLTLAEKVQKASENAENPDEAAANLRDMMNKSDHQQSMVKAQHTYEKQDCQRKERL